MKPLTGLKEKLFVSCNGREKGRWVNFFFGKCMFDVDWELERQKKTKGHGGFLGGGGG